MLHEYIWCIKATRQIDRSTGIDGNIDYQYVIMRWKCKVIDSFQLITSFKLLVYNNNDFNFKLYCSQLVSILFKKHYCWFLKLTIITILIIK